MPIPFDLNIETILENWEVSQAVREVIANALDEQLLTDSKDIEIRKESSGSWIIRDYGRGLRQEDLTQKENEEKLTNPNVIGKFGVGLKDAFATFDRHGVNVEVKSRYNDVTIGKFKKSGFDIETLHAFVSPPSDPKLEGTEFRLTNLDPAEIDRARALFLRFSGEKTIETTKYGEVLERKGDIARIYINGVGSAEEEEFLFSYNITSLTGAIKKALNRERTNVGRSAYQERVKSILLSCRTELVAKRLADDLKEFQNGTNHAELDWKDGQDQAVRILSSTGKYVFLTPEQLSGQAMAVDDARRAGYHVIAVPESLAERFPGMTDLSGKQVVGLGQFIKEYNNSFEFKFVDPNDMSTSERKIYYRTEEIASLVDGMPKVVKELRVSETMVKELSTFGEPEGLWEARTHRIIIKRSALKTIEEYTGVLLHEIAHATSGAADVTREFETELTDLTGRAGAKGLT